MSININITVGDNKLLDQARLQQNASRQAQLEREASQRLTAEATDVRTKALAAQGLDANGNPLSGAPAAKPDIDRRPAANRQEDKIPCFYTITDIDNAPIYYSGDGQQSVKPSNVFLDGPLSDLTPLAELLANPGTAEELAPGSGGFPAGVAGRLILGTNRFEYIFRTVYSNFRSIDYWAPLGNGTALIVKFAQISRATQILRYTYDFDNVFPTSGTTTIETPWAFQYYYTACVVGQSQAAETTLPSLLVQGLKAILIETTNSSFPTYNDYFNNIDFPVQVSLLPSGLTAARSGPVPDAAYNYGVINRYGFGSGAYHPGATPFSWIRISPDYQALSPAEGDPFSFTHEQFYAIGAESTTLGSLFSPKQMLSIDPEYIYPLGSGFPESKITQNGFINEWNGAVLSGPIFDITQLSNYNPANWRRAANFKGPVPDEGSPWNSSGLQRYFIHDWGRPDFCRQQALKYGVTP